MRVIDLARDGFDVPAYDSPEAAIAAADEPSERKARAERDTRELLGTRFVDAWWTDADLVLRFSSGRTLRLFIDDRGANWRLTRKPLNRPPQAEGVGCEAVQVRCQRDPPQAPLVHTWDRSRLVGLWMGREFVQVFPHPTWVFAYFKGASILLATPNRGAVDGAPVLTWDETD